MKINVIVNGKIGVMNLTHSTFIVEDLKAHICNKIGLDVDNYKLKIDFNGDSIELVQTKSNPSFSSNQQKEEPKESNDKSEATITSIINKLWKIHSIEKVHKEDKLTPKDVININRRKEVQLLSVVYKYLTSKGYAELRGNKGYYALKGYDWIANNLHKIENDIEGLI